MIFVTNGVPYARGGEPGDEASATCSLPYLQHLSSTHTNRFPHICVVERNMLLLSEHHPVLPIYLSSQQLRCGIPAFWPQSSSSCCSTLSAWYALLLKLDFRNAFNTLTRDKMLESVKDHAPELFSFIHAAYGEPSLLFCGQHTLVSAEEVQQGDPLGPFFFCLTIQLLVLQLR